MRSDSHRVSFCTIEYSTYNLSSATLCYVRFCQPYSFSSPDLVISSVMPMLKFKNTCLEAHVHTENSVSRYILKEKHPIMSFCCSDKDEIKCSKRKMIVLSVGLSQLGTTIAYAFVILVCILAYICICGCIHNHTYVLHT